MKTITIHIVARGQEDGAAAGGFCSQSSGTDLGGACSAMLVLKVTVMAFFPHASRPCSIHFKYSARKRISKHIAIVGEWTKSLPERAFASRSIVLCKGRFDRRRCY